MNLVKNRNVTGVAFFGSFFSRIADGSLSALMKLMPLGVSNAKNERPRGSERSEEDSSTKCTEATKKSIYQDQLLPKPLSYSI